LDQAKAEWSLYEEWDEAESRRRGGATPPPSGRTLNHSEHISAQSDAIRSSRVQAGELESDDLELVCPPLPPLVSVQQGARAERQSTQGYSSGTSSAGSAHLGQGTGLRPGSRSGDHAPLDGVMEVISNSDSTFKAMVDIMKDEVTLHKDEAALKRQ